MGPIRIEEMDAIAVLPSVAGITRTNTDIHKTMPDHPYTRSPMGRLIEYSTKPMENAPATSKTNPRSSMYGEAILRLHARPATTSARIVPPNRPAYNNTLPSE